MQPSDLLARLRSWHWVALGLAILAVEYATGPFVQFAILFTLPVSLATLTHGLRVGVVVAVLLPLARLLFFVRWTPGSWWALELVDTLVDVVILAGLAALVHRIDQQRRRIQLLEGLLPICSYCKRIREQSGEWRQMESFIAERSAARFSHTFCEQCARTHYPGVLDG